MKIAIKKMTSWFLTLAMCLTMAPWMTLEAKAADDPEVVYYISEFSYKITDEDGYYSTAEFEEHRVTEYQIVDENTTKWTHDPDGTYMRSNGIYVVNRDVTIKERVNVDSIPGRQVTLVICDGCTLIAEKGITVPKGVRLDICVQCQGRDAMSEEAGKLYAGVNADMELTCSSGSAGIGGDASEERTRNCGEIYIHGGTVVAAAGNDEADTPGDGTSFISQQAGGAGIGGSAYGNGGTVYMCNANVRASAGKNCTEGGAGIGGGAYGNCGTINIFRSDVTATSGGEKYGGAGIGSGGLARGFYSDQEEYVAGNILIAESTVTASGGDVDQESGGAGIGGGGESDGGEVTIFLGDVKATGGSGAAGIGGGCTGSACDLQVLSAHVEAYGGSGFEIWGSVCGAGIGTGGNKGELDTVLSGGKVTIAGKAEVTAVGGSVCEGLVCTSGGAGIGGGGSWNVDLSSSSPMIPPAGCDVEVTGGTVIAKGGNASPDAFGHGGAGIGTGGYEEPREGVTSYIDCGKLTITGGTVQAYGGRGTDDGFYDDGEAFSDGRYGYGGSGVGIGGTGTSFYSKYKDMPVQITGGSLVAIGGNGNTPSSVGQAIGGVVSGSKIVKVTNSMAGAGWTTRDREDNGTLIGIETENGRFIGGYNAAAFPVYALTLDSNDGTGTAVTRYVIDGDSLPANIFSRAGHILDGWNTLAVPTEEDPGNAYSNEEILDITGDMTLYAQWKEAETVATPEFSPDGDTFDSAQDVTIFCATEGATIYYTTDGSTPSTGSAVYSTAINVSKDMTIKAIAFKEGMVNSSIASATYTIIPMTYTVTVINGTGSNYYEEGESVRIIADEPLKGRKFKEWLGADGLNFTSGSATTAEAVFTMPANAVELTATYEEESTPIPKPTTYTVTVINGTGSNYYEEGESVRIIADEPLKGRKFKEWLGADGLSFTSGSATTAEAVFTMPANAVELTATYEEESTPIQGPIAVTGVKLNWNGINLHVGDTQTLKAYFTPVNATNKEVAWSSDRTDIATVDADGKVTAVSPGWAVITVTTADGGKTAFCTVYVIAPAAPGSSGGGSSGRASGGSSSGSGNTQGTGDQKPVEEQTPVTEPATSTTIEEGKTPLAEVPEFEDVTLGAFYAEPVAWAIENSITNGLSGNKFGPAEKCTRAQVLTFIYRAMGSPAVSSSGLNFTDVSSDSYYRDAVAWAVGMGITSGTSETTFDPDATCTRAQIVTLLWRAAGSPKVESTVAFSDVTPDMYCYDAVVWAVSRGITQGTSDTTFSPDETCDRGQVVTFLYRYIKTKA